MNVDSAPEHRTATFASHDGAQLFYQCWLPPGSWRQALLLFHRGHEHSDRWAETVKALDLPEVAIFAMDARGHGNNPGPRGAAENFGVMIRDIEAFVQHLKSTHGLREEDTMALGHSVGAVALAGWVHDYAPRLRGLILGTPAFRIKLYIPFAIPLLRLKEKWFGPGVVKSYVKSHLLTHDREQAAAYNADARIFREISVRILLDVHDTGRRLVEDAAAIRVPTLMLGAGADWVVRLSSQRKFFERLSSPDKTFELLPGFHHAIFHEAGRAEMVATIRRWIMDRFSAPPAQLPSLRDAHKSGWTADETARLAAGRRGISAALQRFMLRTMGSLSDGIRLGWRSGFDSGTTLDYVYENRPRGRTFLGRMIDRQYLESPGWTGIRQRRVHLQRLLTAAMKAVHGAGRPVHIVDIACGAGRYVLETLQANPDIPATALLRDYKAENVAATTALRDSLGLKNVTVMQGDAFDEPSLASLSPRPTIAIVSGLYELIPDNDLLERSLRGLAAATDPGAVLIYTGQPWHPQLKFIAHVLTNREGQAWVMRRRTQEEMDELVRLAGFRKAAEEADQWGIFTVSTATRQ
jgi:alpha-beta hydrolase superfamily lysophospholipase/SAM-dependent methyltransferase